VFAGESKAYTTEFVECDRTFDGVREVVKPNRASHIQGVGEKVVMSIVSPLSGKGRTFSNYSAGRQCCKVKTDVEHCRTGEIKLRWMGERKNPP
jgi:hypothetical protein